MSGVISKSMNHWIKRMYKLRNKSDKYINEIVLKYILKSYSQIRIINTLIGVLNVEERIFLIKFLESLGEEDFNPFYN